MERRWGSGDKEWGIRGWQGRAHLRGLGDGKEAQCPRGQGGWAVKDTPPPRKDEGLWREWIHCSPERQEEDTVSALPGPQAWLTGQQTAPSLTGRGSLARLLHHFDAPFLHL